MSVWDESLDLNLQSTRIDLSYLEEHGNRDSYHIPTCFEVCNYKMRQSFKAKVTYAYDPSKFWITTKYRELEIFQKYLFRFYYINHAHYKVPEDKIAMNLYCIVFIDNSYYRGVIVGFPITCQDDETEVQVHFIDYGMSGIISINNIYYMSEKCLKVPQFAIRAFLAGICPSHDGSWSSGDVIKFNDLITDKILVGVILCMDTERQLVGAHIGVQNGNKISLIHEALIAQKCAKYCDEKETAKVHGILKYPYLFPLHEDLESGKVPNKVSDAEYQEQITSPLSAPYLRNYCQKKMTEKNNS